MKCKICNKTLKENTEGKKQFCQGHYALDETRQDLSSADRIAIAYKKAGRL